MKQNKYIVTLFSASLASLLVAAAPSYAELPHMGSDEHGEAHEADNTGVNARDDKESSKTPFDQGSSEKDRDITAKIRRQVVEDDSLSMNAHNVKIITENGKVTLRGPVKSEAERKQVAQKAMQIAGNANVMNELEVAAH